jgi:hypothetical protein
MNKIKFKNGNIDGLDRKRDGKWQQTWGYRRD